MQQQERDVLEAFLCKRWSHRKIQRDVLGLDAQERGGGFHAMEILHRFGVHGEHKGVLAGQAIDWQRFSEGGNIKRYLSGL